MAQDADWGICLARTDSDRPKHEGITCFLVDMKSPGVDIRPLRELTGASLFNEVFLSDVFVPDDCVVGAVNDGWRVGAHDVGQRAGVDGRRRRHRPECRRGAQARPEDADTALLDEVGCLVAEPQALAVLGVRLTLRALAGADAGPAASVRKLSAPNTISACRRPGLSLLGAEGAVDDGGGRSVDQRAAVEPLPHHRRRHQRNPAQRHRRAPARPPQGSVIPARGLLRGSALL